MGRTAWHGHYAAAKALASREIAGLHIDLHVIAETSAPVDDGRLL
ncbi:hypothetical protein [Mesorhizobium liriopis]|nr:hypothetical protein [Mesorhizobium liriopis]